MGVRLNIMASKVIQLLFICLLIHNYSYYVNCSLTNGIKTLNVLSRIKRDFFGNSDDDDDDKCPIAGDQCLKCYTEITDDLLANMCDEKYAYVAEGSITKPDGKCGNIDISKKIRWLNDLTVDKIYYSMAENCPKCPDLDQQDITFMVTSESFDTYTEGFFFNSSTVLVKGVKHIDNCDKSLSTTTTTITTNTNTTDDLSTQTPPEITTTSATLLDITTESDGETTIQTIDTTEALAPTFETETLPTVNMTDIDNNEIPDQQLEERRRNVGDPVYPSAPVSGGPMNPNNYANNPGNSYVVQQPNQPTINGGYNQGYPVVPPPPPQQNYGQQYQQQPNVPYKPQPPVYQPVPIQPNPQYNYPTNPQQNYGPKQPHPNYNNSLPLYNQPLLPVPQQPYPITPQQQYPPQQSLPYSGGNNNYGHNNYNQSNHYSNQPSMMTSSLPQVNANYSVPPFYDYSQLQYSQNYNNSEPGYVPNAPISNPQYNSNAQYTYPGQNTTVYGHMSQPMAPIYNQQSVYANQNYGQPLPPPPANNYNDQQYQIAQQYTVNQQMTSNYSQSAQTYNSGPYYESVNNENNAYNNNNNNYNDNNYQSQQNVAYVAQNTYTPQLQQVNYNQNSGVYQNYSQSNYDIPGYNSGSGSQLYNYNNYNNTNTQSPQVQYPYPTNHYQNGPQTPVYGPQTGNNYTDGQPIYGQQNYATNKYTNDQTVQYNSNPYNNNNNNNNQQNYGSSQLPYSGQPYGQSNTNYSPQQSYNDSQTKQYNNAYQYPTSGSQQYNTNQYNGYNSNSNQYYANTPQNYGQTYNNNNGQYTAGNGQGYANNMGSYDQQNRGYRQIGGGNNQLTVNDYFASSSDQINNYAPICPPKPNSCPVCPKDVLQVVTDLSKCDSSGKRRLIHAIKGDYMAQLAPGSGKSSCQSAKLVESQPIGNLNTTFYISYDKLCDCEAINNNKALILVTNSSLEGGLSVDNNAIVFGYKYDVWVDINKIFNQTKQQSNC
ncbi:putative uncharacterized protein DDB_G0282129 isoform X2 [Oppia nitens]|uniref:putative uncharacterized protein DDB_G0282129 isoform X2 n=1 Tax=Oppia nitens TaxID=1686743 RepID=UPI0023D9D4B3|nr:putative uncharacterized protein DDB_G0282129 isoform X2 [Oppia nitens]